MPIFKRLLKTELCCIAFLPLEHVTYLLQRSCSYNLDIYKDFVYIFFMTSGIVNNVVIHGSDGSGGQSSSFFSFNRPVQQVQQFPGGFSSPFQFTNFQSFQGLGQVCTLQLSFFKRCIYKAYLIQAFLAIFFTSQDSENAEKLSFFLEF